LKQKNDGNLEKTKIVALKKTLNDLGIEKAELEPKEKGIFLLKIEEGFQLAKDATGIILKINGLKILIEGYHSLFPLRENYTQKSIFLQPITPPRA